MILLLVLLLTVITFGSSANPCDSIHFVTRAHWHAKPSHLETMHTKPVHNVFIHHTEEAQCHTEAECIKRVQGIQEFHQKTRGWSDIGYNFLVGGDGNVYIGRGWDKIGAHTRGMNDKAIAISLMGNYMKVVPSQKMLTVTEELIACGKHLGFVAENAQIHGHRDQNCTDCPGDALYAIIKKWKNFHGGHLSSFVC